MNKKKRLTISVTLICMVFMAIIASAAGAQPGSDMDPLVTKSYVDQQIAARLGTGTSTPSGTTVTTGTADSATVEQLKVDVGELTHFIIDALNQLDGLKAKIASAPVAGSGDSFVVVEVPGGKTILLSGGSEAILRSGQGVSVKGLGGGLADVTSGVDLADKVVVPLQHLLISSRSDGRGILIKGTKGFLLIRGDFTLK